MKINFLIADEVRPESSGKQTILGLYADNNIVLEGALRPSDVPQDLPDGIDRLAFLVCVYDAPNEKHSFKAQITDPSGANHGPEISFGETVFGVNISRTIVLEAKPFVIPSKGVYHFNLYVDDTIHTFPFSIIDRADIKHPTV